MIDMLVSLFYRIALEPAAVLVEVILIGLCVNWVVGVLQGTRGTRPLRGMLMILVVATVVVRVLVSQFGWVRLELLYNYVLTGLALTALVVFQPELRRAIIRVGDVRIGRTRLSESQLVSSLVKSSGYLSKNKFGALIAVERNVDLTGWAENGTMINAEVTPNLINSIFYPGSALHDLGVIIRGNSVVAANCQFPSAASDEIDMAIGSRHLAALGMSYETDALVLVISEESGVISIADNGKLKRYLSLDELAEELTSRLGRSSTVLEKGRLWSRVRRLLVVLPLTMIVWYLTDQATLAQATVDVELTVQHENPTFIVDVLQPRPVGGGMRGVEALSSEATRLRATFVGSARAIDRVRRDTADKPLRIKWALARADATVGDHTLPSDEFQARLDQLPELTARGLSVHAAALTDFRYRVDERVQLHLPVQPDAGATSIAIHSVNPPRATAVFRAQDFSSFLGKPPSPADLEQFAAERSIRAPLNDLIVRWEPEVPQTIEVALDYAIGSLTAAALDPQRVAVEMRVVGQRRKIENVVANLFLSPGIDATYQVEKVDENEWRMDIEVTGREAMLRDLGPADVQAFVRVTPDMLPPTDAPPAEQVRLVNVTILTPEGVSVVSGPPRTVRVRLVPRASVPA